MSPPEERSGAGSGSQQSPAPDHNNNINCPATSSNTESSSVTDLRDDAPLYVGDAFKTLAGRPVSVNQLAAHYDPPKPNNLRQLKTDLGEHDARDLKIHLITDVLEYAGAGKAFTYDDSTGTWNLAEGVDIDSVTYGDQPLTRKRQLPDLFNPETGVWRDNVRSFTTEGLKSLRDSMKAFGWLPHLPAIQDEHGVVIVGHRRLAVAEDLGIEPNIEIVTFGDGEAADAKRVALALASNIGGEQISRDDRKKICEDLYVSAWSMPKIADLLKVSVMTVSRDLRGLTDVKPQPKRGGRPRKGKGKIISDPEPKPVELDDNPEPEPVTQDDVDEDVADPESVELDDDDPEPGPVTQESVDRDAAEEPPTPSDFTLFDDVATPTEVKPAPPVANKRMTRFANAATVMQKKAIYLTIECQKKDFALNLADVSGHRDFIMWLRETFAATHTLIDLLTRLPEQPQLPFQDGE